MSESSGNGGVSRADIQAVSRASRILGLFNVDHLELVTAEVAARLGLNRTTTHRYLTSMVAVGLLEPGSRHSSYVVGPLATRLGAMATGAATALSVAPRFMPGLAEELSATITLSVWASTGPMIVHVAEPPLADAVLTMRVGTVLPVDSAQGVLFAVNLPSAAPRAERVRERLDAEKAAAFEAHMADARADGLSVVRHPDVGVVAVAAPLFDRNGMCAVLAVVGLAGVTTEAAVPVRSARLRVVAAELTAELGGTRPAPESVRS